MNISCVINTMGAGGAERVMVSLAGGLAARGHRVTVNTLDASVPDFYVSPPGVARASARCAGDCRWYQVGRQVKRTRALRNLLREQAPDLVIGFVDVTNVLTLAAFRSSGVPVVVCEHINPLHHPLGPHWRLLRRALYPSAARVVMLTEDTLGWARSVFPAWRATAIPDPVPSPVFSPAPERPPFFGPERNLVSMGRLNRQKGFDILLRVFSGLAGRFPDWNLTILGDGPDRAALEAQRESLGLGGRVALPGNFKLPHDIIRQGDLFVVSSRYEGFCLALAEALGCGLPAVSFDCPSGPSLLVRHGVDGLLVPNGDERALAEALADLMRDGARRARMAERAPEIVERFSETNYIDRWEELIADIFPRGPERE